VADFSKAPRRGSLILAALALSGAAPAERKAVLNALRPAVEAKLGARVEFVVTHIAVEDRWAFVVADPQRRGGKPIDIRKHFPDQWDNMDGLRVEGVLQKRGGRWRVVDMGIGATDVWYCDVGPRRLKRGWGC
jgi:hypothetical protein